MNSNLDYCEFQWTFPQKKILFASLCKLCGCVAINISRKNCKIAQPCLQSTFTCNVNEKGYRELAVGHASMGNPVALWQSICTGITKVMGSFPFRTQNYFRSLIPNYFICCFTAMKSPKNSVQMKFTSDKTIF